MGVFTKIIIVAAGEGTRLRPKTDNIPKCMVEVGGKPMLEYQLDVIRECGVKDIVLIKGYKEEKIQYDDIKYYINDEYYKNNMLKSLFYARDEINGSFILSFADNIYSKELFNKVLGNQDDISLMVDRDWKNNYVDRSMHPMGEANLVKVENDKIVKIGRDNIIKDDEAFGEMIGFFKFSDKGAEILKKRYDELTAEYASRTDQSFHNSKIFEKAFIADMIQELIDLGHTIKPIQTHGGWVEIDTVEDFNKIEEKIKNNENFL